MGAVILWCFGMVMNVVSPLHPHPAASNLCADAHKYGYYLPVFFQSAQGTSATLSGVRFIELIIPQIVTLAITGVIVSRWAIT